ncbi:MAG: hypothetical protein ACREXU_10155, partial [Gammaproteobacteria bacterium]
VAAYEALRGAVLAPAGPHTAERGLTLLMRRGMAAWMREYAAHATLEREPTAVAGAPATAVAPETRAQLVGMLVSMIFGATLKEVHP